MNSKVLSVVLGGGQGSRLYPLTDTRSKPAVPIAGKYRLVDIPISNCLNSGIERIFVLTQFNSASLNKHIKNTYHFSFFSEAFVDILAAEQTPGNSTWFQGTADAVRQSLGHIVQHQCEYVLILSGDQLYQMDFGDMVRSHEESGAEISIATIPVNARDASDFGILKADENNLITSFIEKPKKELLPEWKSEVGDELKSKGKEYLASMGIYLFNRKLLLELLENNTRTDFGKEIIPQSLEDHKVISYKFEGYWTDIGNIHSFFEANIGLTDDIPEFNLFDKKSIYSRARMLPPSKISGTTLEKTIIADGCIINASRIERSIIGIRTRIGIGTTIVNSYVMGGDRYQTLNELNEALEKKQPIMGIGERCYIKNAIIDKNCFIGDDVRINGGNHLENGDFKTHTIKDGIVVVKKLAVIPNGTVI
ncbi:MAG: glucose-1-phosphate adenylyltransferase [Sphingobacteriales bacterium 17-39-43]|uniref:glucose-1-phosphate adenylyltransferase n=1 Tax=Daejeonella sp. TaxID=2805397 RepID=UPI000BD3009B|nr:glucose-1-phosphate adenylyltransferase [Daejeonella sp.]OYZ30760.1 MAG: glucose-1-phosphate adenylyltransferase [Sphingobacteriales bacterium 16-39-50]OZA23500.1 MAG: glucose-1-phosphate adenylyltransferase [Sphingobacteriales bacterium 17-39-43]HQT23818.1 glucose-1-phosphate adenylyltransferase [Daejeonella sp.]HQT58529.1 glucose-1-phosphate adenylyltransferase [Daejeonella sp.]